MESINFDQIIAFLNSSNYEIVRLAVLAYIGLLWISIIVWIARDSISRSSSLFFQTISIFIGIFIPFLGVLIYLIIRPSKTTAEVYYEELEHRLITDDSDNPDNSCEKCTTALAHDFLFCPNCGEPAKQTCDKCKRHFPLAYPICPYCGEGQAEEKKKPVRKRKKKVKKAKDLTEEGEEKTLGNEND